ncbi:hypothetical protein AAG570_009690 [Ranatra chinensis]|uniref:AN1-type domain-containing protein n=1 Tax=Ranatra chinensis TaxID=642074 RepID=A0ABD0YQ25_9HEMI
MEFPDLGLHCGFEGCNQLDLLPIGCSHCGVVFCRHHAPALAHECSKVPDNIVKEKKNSSSFKCHFDGCNTNDAIEMNCIVCRLHFCLEHRHHGCLDGTRKDKWQAPKLQFNRAKAETDKVVDGKLKATSNRALANKIRLMKLKRVAVGDNHIPVVDRVFFCVAPPVGTDGGPQHESRAIFVNKQWPVGRAVDSISKRLKLNNRNNETGAPKLLLFSSQGEILATKRDTTIESLVQDGILTDGDSLILETMTQEELDAGKTTFLKSPDQLAKYKWA